VGKMIVFDGKIGMRKFGSAAPPFGKVACVVKVFDILEYPVMVKTRITHFINVINPLLSIDIDKEIVYKVIK